MVGKFSDQEMWIKKFLLIQSFIGSLKGFHEKWKSILFNCEVRIDRYLVITTIGNPGYFIIHEIWLETI